MSVTIYTKTKTDELLAGKATSGHQHDAGAIVSGTVPPARLGSGTPEAGKYLDGAGAWTPLPTGNGATINDSSASTSTVYSSTKTAQLLAAKADTGHSHTPEQITGPVPISKGGTGQTTAAAALQALGGVSMTENADGTVTIG